MEKLKKDTTGTRAAGAGMASAPAPKRGKRLDRIEAATLESGMSKETAKDCAAVMKAMGHPTRVMVLHALRNQPCCECDLLNLFRISQPTLSRHLAVLKKSGLVTEQQAGPRKFLTLATRAGQPHVARMHNLMTTKAQP